jgi:FSR family fosmidomycin resistance protein-like MFS transporter
MAYLLPLLLGLAHGVSDASAGLLVGITWQLSSPNGKYLILLYNGLAFGLQPLAGLLLDRINQPRRGAAIGLLCTAAGVAVAWWTLTPGLVLVGIGSALLHAGGGAVAIKSQPGRAGGVGLFAAFGVVGLTLGTMASAYLLLTTIALLLTMLAALALVLWFWKPEIFPTSRLVSADPFTPAAWAIALLLVIAIALRSLVWTGVQVSRYSVTALQLALAAGAGKLLGGFAADRFGWGRWAVGALAGALCLLAFGANWGPAILLGVALLQSFTPLSIAALGKTLPNSPALATSLALGLAIMAGGLPFFILTPGWFGIAVMLPILLVSGGLYWLALVKLQKI